MSLAPLPEDRYNSHDELLAGAKAWAATNGYAVTIARSNASKGVVYLKCDRGERYRNQHQLTDDQRERQTRSPLINCPLSAVGSCIQGVWYLKT